MIGGTGDDIFIVDNAGDVTNEAANAGTDTVLASISHTIGANIENLTLTGSANINGTGNALDNIITGNSGDNVLDGGAGADQMAAGAGNDTYVVDNAADVVSELAGEGTDTVLASVSHVLGDNFENLALTGTANIDGTGNALDNVITGNSGNNVLDGGTGADQMAGGLGDDTYIVDDAGDVITENENAGMDLVRAAMSYTLGANLENLTLEGSALTGTGNALDNIITGNALNNIIDGGQGADTMTGGAGDDTYYVDHAGDMVVEGAGEGIDTVITSIAHSLSANIEHLTLTGNAAINGTGNELDNTITGNNGDNVLDGGDGKDFIVGGNGNDVIYGGDGNDNLWGQNGDDTIYGGAGVDNTNGGAGNDAIYAGDGNDGLFGGGGQDILFGEGGNDKIYGDGGNDIIRGGAGDDWLVGGQLQNGFSAGNDTFVWTRDDIVDGTGTRIGFDQVVDFGAGDRLDFSGVFSGQPPAPIEDLVRVTDWFNGTLVAVHIDDTVGWVDALILRDVHGIDLDDLTAQGAIIV